MSCCPLSVVTVGKTAWKMPAANVALAIRSSLMSSRLLADLTRINLLLNGWGPNATASPLRALAERLDDHSDDCVIRAAAGTRWTQRSAGGLGRAVSTPHSCAHNVQRQCITSAPRS